MDSKIEKIRKESFGLSIIIKILLVLTSVYFIIEIIYTVFILFLPPSAFTVIKSESGYYIKNSVLFFDIGNYVGNNIIHDFDTLATTPKPALLINLFAGLVTSGLLVAIFFFTNQIFRSFSIVHTPFTLENGKRIKIIAILLLIIATVPIWLRLILYFFVYLESGTYIIGSNFVLILFSLVFMCLSYIFSYGCDLQQEVDETL